MAERKLDTQSVSDMLEINQNLSRNFMSTDDWENTFADGLMIDFGGVKPPQKTTPKDLMDWAKKTYATVKTQTQASSTWMSISTGTRRHQNPMVMPAHERTDNGDFWHIYAQFCAVL